MKMIGLVLVALLALVAGLWFAWRQGWVGETALPGPLPALQAHLRAQGLDTYARLTRRDLADVNQRVHFQLVGRGQRAFWVLWCNSPEAAQRHVQRLLNAASPSLPQANGPFVLYMTDWPADDPLTRQVQGAFASFPAAGTAAVPRP